MKTNLGYATLLISAVLNILTFVAVADEDAQRIRIDLLKRIESDLEIVKEPDLQIVVDSLSDQYDLVRGQAASVVEALVVQRKIDDNTSRKMYNALFRALSDLKDDCPIDFEGAAYDDFIWARSMELLAAMKLGLNSMPLGKGF